MLNSICPEDGCNSPLMRDTTGTEMCVSCPASASPGNETRVVPVQAAGDRLGETSMEDKEEEDEEEDRMLDDDAGRLYAQQRMAEFSSPATASTSGRTKLGGGNVASHELVKKEALDTLYRALDVSQRRLREFCSDTIEIEESTRHAELITRIAVAARAVSDLPIDS